MIWTSRCAVDDTKNHPRPRGQQASPRRRWKAALAGALLRTKPSIPPRRAVSTCVRRLWTALAWPASSGLSARYKAKGQPDDTPVYTPGADTTSRAGLVDALHNSARELQAVKQCRARIACGIECSRDDNPVLWNAH